MQSIWTYVADMHISIMHSATLAIVFLYLSQVSLIALLYDEVDKCRHFRFYHTFCLHTSALEWIRLHNSSIKTWDWEWGCTFLSRVPSKTSSAPFSKNMVLLLSSLQAPPPNFRCPQYLLFRKLHGCLRMSEAAVIGLIPRPLTAAQWPQNETSINTKTDSDTTNQVSVLQLVWVR